MTSRTGNFWCKVPRPCFVLAPMANVTDAAFRKLIASFGAPDVTWTEFVSADGLISPGKDRLLVDLQFSTKERPIVAQLFTGHPQAMKKAAALCAKLGFDGIDINMGCPDRAVERQGGGASLIRNSKVAFEVIQAAREGWGGMKTSHSKFSISNFPVSVKTRIGYNSENIEEWIGGLLKISPPLPALTVHLRTRKEMSLVPAHWELMPQIVKLRDMIQSHLPVESRTRIIGNGDIQSVAHAKQKVKETGCDGVMIGRGIFGTPWLFEKEETLLRQGFEGQVKKQRVRSPEEKLSIMLKHVQLFEKMYGEGTGTGRTQPGHSGPRLKNFATMKKHFKAYVTGFDGAKELRAQLMETENAKEVRAIIRKHIT